MEKEPTHTAGADLSAHLPLESIILYLKSNGFSIKPDDYIEVLKVIERFKPASLEEAGTLICPLIATNEEEQARFYIVFKKLCEPGVLTEPPPPLPLPWWKKFLQGCKKLFTKKNIKYLLLLIPVLIGLSWILNKPAIWRHPKPKVTGVSILFPVSMERDNWQVGDSIPLSADWLMQLGDSTWNSDQYPGDSSKMKLEWNINGSEIPNKRDTIFVPSQPGNNLVILRMCLDDELFSTDTANILVCEITTAIKIANYPDSIDFSQTIPLGDTLKLRAKLGEHNFSDFPSAWIVGNDTVNRNTDTLQLTLTNEGEYDISFVRIPKPGKPGCNNISRLHFSVKDPNEKEFRLDTSPTGDTIKPPKKIKNWVQDIILFLFLTALIVSLILRWIIRRRKRAVNKIIDTVIDPTPATPDNKKPVFEIPLENRQQQLIASEPLMNDVMRLMLQRTMDESLALNINKTVQNTIRSGGVPELVYSNKLRPNDYLVLVDSTVTGSQQLKLFEYLVKTFKTENISVVRFFYQDNFSKFYNEEYPLGISVKRLAELYKDFTLIIYGAAHHLLYDAYPVLDAERFNELADWENKGILTPVPFKDWGIKEKLIGGQIILLPADAEGHLRLLKAINEKLLNHRDYLSSAKDFYSAGKYDFTEPADIKTYLDDDDLYQWICSIAIYPKIRWEVLIELGKAVLQSRGCPEKMNYSNLLKLVRISWLHEGYFPEDTRLELLKELGVQEEIVARKKLVELFQYADLYFKDNYFFSNEKKVQEVTNKFIIYANDPVTNEDYTSSKEQFEAMWKQNKITDAPLKEYINDPKKASWETPIGDPGVTTVGEERPIPKMAKWSRVFSEIAGVCLLLLLGISQFGNDLAKTGAAKFLGISATDSSRLVLVTVDISPFGKCMDFANDSTLISNVTFSLYTDPDKPYEPNNPTEITLIPIDSNNKINYDIPSQMFKLPYRSLSSGDITLKIDWKYQHNPLDDVRGRTRADAFDDVITSSTATTGLAFTTNKITTTVSGCDRDTLTKIIIKYNDPGMETAARDFAGTLSGKGFQNVTTSQETITDSLQVRFYERKDMGIANALEKEASGYFKKTYRTFFAPITEAASRHLFEILVYNKPVETATCTPIAISQLPPALTEIWKGVSINQFITIDARNKKIWLSKGDKKVYDSYNIINVCLSATGVYRIIGEINNRYKVFFIKNVQSNQFILSVCDGFPASLEKAMEVDESNCNNYHRMNIYNNEPAFPVPANVEKSVYFFVFQPNDQLFPSEYRRLNNVLTAAARAGKRGETVSLINTFFTPKNLANALQEKQFNTTRTKLPLFFGPEQKAGTVLDNISKSQTFDGTPFDRHCLRINLSNCPTWNSNLTIIKKTYSFNLVEKGKTFMNRSTLKQIVSDLNLNSDANLKILKNKLLNLIDNAPSNSDPNYNMEFTEEAQLIRKQIQDEIQKYVDNCK